MRKFLLFIILSQTIVSQKLFANEVITLKEVKFNIFASRASEKLSLVINDSEGILKQFTPSAKGVTFGKKMVSGSAVSFPAKIGIGFISKSVEVKGHLLIVDAPLKCKENETGFLGTLDLIGSDNWVYKNTEKLEIIACVYAVTEKQLNVRVKGRLIRSVHYDSISGPLVESIISSQMAPLNEAITTLVERQ
jgi:hypothetical protein